MSIFMSYFYNVTFVGQLGHTSLRGTCPLMVVASLAFSVQTAHKLHITWDYITGDWGQTQIKWLSMRKEVDILYSGGIYFLADDSATKTHKRLEVLPVIDRLFFTSVK